MKRINKIKVLSLGMAGALLLTQPGLLSYAAPEGAADDNTALETLNSTSASFAGTAAQPQEIPDDAIFISDLDSFFTFAKNCTLDTWSVGKTFVLDCDLDLSSTETASSSAASASESFTSIPTFGGIFLGQGHTISGLTLNGTSNYIGLFRYVQESGEIYDLSVSGNAEAESTHTGLGLLAGSNSGLISGCRTYGSIVGGEEAGNLVGKNELTGIISNCISSGSVTGKHLVGGLSGCNDGSILNSTNHCAVNTAASENEISLSSLDRAATDETLTELLTTENAASVTDIGGIAGCNNGIIRACVNDGNTGYRHVGYNIGGIAGSQTGYIEGCLNYGTLNGRKDIGGIAGQMEPSSELEFSEDTLKKLDTEFDTLHQLLTNLDNDLGDSSTSLTDQVDALITSVEGFQSALDEILDQAGTDLSDFSRLTDLNTLSSPDPISLDFLDDITLPSISPSSSPDASASPSGSELPSAVPSGSPAESSSPSALPSESPEESSTPSASPSESPEGSSSPSVLPSESPEGNSAASALPSGKSIPVSSPAVSSETGSVPVPTALSAGPGNLTRHLLYDNPVSPSAPKGTTAPETSTSPKASVIPGGSSSPDTSAAPGSSASPDHSGWPSLPSISPSIELNPDDFDDFDKEAAEEELNRLQDSVYQSASEILENTENLIRSQADKASARVSSAHASLSGSFSSIISDTRLLNSMLDDQNQIILDDFQAIIDELNVITDLITNPEATDPDDILMDVSDEDQVTDIAGKVMNCVNKGSVNGDINAGGIAGSLSRENNLDPENDLDIDNNSTLNFRYKERIVIRQCENNAVVTGKKDRIGGIAGEMLLGSVLECTNTGNVMSEGGSVGGVAGYSETSIRSSSAKCSLSGTDRVGGIAGYGETITDCRSMVEITDAESYFGSVAGQLSSSAEVKNNYFVKGSPAGIDGIDYSGMAEPLSYEAFMELPGLPDAFSNLYLTFKAEDQVVSTVTLNYGESFNISQLPAVPEKEGCTGKWSDFDYENITFDQTIEAIYTEYVSTLEYAAEDGSLPELLVEGQFEPEDTLSVKGIDAYPQDSLTTACCYKVTADSSYTGSYVVRYRIPADMENPQIELFSDQTWTPVEAETDGSYLVFQVPGQPFVFSCVERPATTPVGLLIVLGICALLLLGLFIAILILRKKARQKNSPASDSPSDKLPQKEPPQSQN